ncbi:MAG TPA: cytidine deaminase [Planctomycetota bacterium]|jgi:cytidine deaminase|nr:cytidine deaminase [Planctomycetota bacterium]
METPDDDELVRLAREAMGQAHSPYSQMQVGAALVTASGRIFSGCNVENASYGLTLCAERTAVVKAVSAGERAFTQLAITTSRGAPLMPCGACRQFLREFGGELRILVEGQDGERLTSSLAELLPQAFEPADLAPEGGAGGAAAGG